MPLPKKNAGDENVNLPKCVNCLKNLCNAGMVNHDTHNNNDRRQECLFECGCLLFEEYTGQTIDLTTAR